MDREERFKKMNALLDKEDFDYYDYKALKELIKEMEEEYQDLKKRFREAVYGTK